MNYLYHVAVLRPEDGGMRMVPAAHLHAPLAIGIDTRGGDPLIDEEMAGCSEVIDGDRVGDYLDWRERPRKAREECERARSIAKGN